MQVADHRGDPDHLLAVEVDDQAQHAVSGGVVRAEVDLQEVVGLAQPLRNVERRS